MRHHVDDFGGQMLVVSSWNACIILNSLYILTPGLIYFDGTIKSYPRFFIQANKVPKDRFVFSDWQDFEVLRVLMKGMDRPI